MTTALERRVTKLEQHICPGNDSDLSDDELKRIIVLFDKTDRSEAEQVELRQLEDRMPPAPDYLSRLSDEELIRIINAV